MKLNINGQSHQVEVDPKMPLLWVLRDILNMTGTKYGCGVAACGACTVHIDGEPTRSCLYPVSSTEGKEITTIEGLAKKETLTVVQEAWIKHQVPQCGYCQSGMIMAVEALLNKFPEPTDEDINRDLTNICRCGTYQRIRSAIKEAVAQRVQNVIFEETPNERS